MIGNLPNAKAVSDRRTIGKETTCHGLVDDGDFIGRLGILSVEETAFDKPNAHSGEKSLAGNVEEDDVAVPLCPRDAREKHQVGPSALIEREESKAISLDTGDGLDAVFNLLLEMDGANFIGGSMRQVGGAGVERKVEDIVLVETQVDIGEMNQTAYKESRNNEQHNRKRNLSHDERAGQGATRGGRRTAAPILKCRRELNARCAECRQHAEQERRCHRDP